MPGIDDIDALVRSLTDPQSEVKVEELLESALAEPMLTEARFRRIEQVLEVVKGYGLLDREDPGNLHLLLSLGRAYERFSHLEKAYETYEAALALADRLEDERAHAMLLCRMGRVLSRWERWEEGLDYLARGQQAYRALEDEEGQARATLGRGIIFQEQGDYTAAAGAYQKAVELARRAGSSKILIDATNNLAILASIRGNFENAVTLYQECLTACQQIDNTLGTARAYHNLGMTYADRGQWDAALDCYGRSLEIAQKEGQIEIEANVCLSRAELLVDMGDSSKAANWCERALDIYRGIKSGLGEADTYRLLGRVFSLTKQWTAAERMFRDSLRLNEENDHPLGTAEAHRDLGKMHAARSRTADARASYETALAGFRKLGAQADVAEVDYLIRALEA